MVGFGYDNADRRTSLALPGSLEVLYGYDDASQLLSLTYRRSGATIGDLAGTYDGAGRRTTTSGTYARLSLPAAQSTTIYNANNQLTKWGNKTLSYDLNGNMLGDLSNTFSWNARDQLSAVTKTGQTLPSFTYDAFGRRQKKTLGANVTSYLYDGANAVQELTGATPSANMLTGLGVDEVFQRTEGATPRAFLSDALGGTLALADSAGVVQTSYTYSPYGETTVTGTASNNTSQYTGRENDNDGLYFYRARYYHPVFSRFVSEDPIGFRAGSANLYAYVHGDPIALTDPSGKIAPWLAACAAGAAFNVVFDVGFNALSGRKTSAGSLLSSAGGGCMSGLVGFGIGSLLSKVVKARTAGQVLYHYTDDAGAAGIRSSGQLLPGRSGNVFVSPTRYTSASQAQAELALPRLPTSVLEVPKNRLPGLSSPSRVKPAFGQPGGGVECWVTCAVDVANLPILRLGR